MLCSLEGKPIKAIPRGRALRFRSLTGFLGEEKTEEIIVELMRLIDEMAPDPETGARRFNTSHLGSRLTPWQGPIAYLYEAAEAMADAKATQDEIQTEASFGFGLFVWERMIRHPDEWAVYDLNLPGDLNTEVTGKVYFERL